VSYRDRGVFMFRMSKKKILIFIDLTNSDTVEFAVVKGKNIIESGSCNIKELEKIKKDMNVNYASIAVLSELSYFDIARLTVRNKKLMRTAIARYINEQSVFMESYISRYKEINKSGDVYDVALCAFPESDIKRIEYIKSLFIVEYIKPVEYVLVKMAKHLNPNADNVVWTHNGLQLEIEIDRDCIKTKSVRPYSEEESIDKTFFGENTVFFEESLDKNNYVELDLKALSVAHIYGLLFVDKYFDFIDENYFHNVVSFELSKFVFAFSTVAALVFMLLGANQYFTYVDLSNQFEQKSRLLRQKENYIKSNMPPQDEISVLFEVAKLQKKFKSQLDLGKFLTWVTNITPNNAIIDSMNIAVFKEEKNNKNTAIAPNAKGVSTSNDVVLNINSKNFNVEIKLLIDGNYKKTKDTALNFLKELSSKITTESNDFTYNEKKNQAIFVTRFKVDGSKF